MAVEASTWVSYDDAADMLGLSPEAAKRLALRGGWARRAGPAGVMEVAVPAGFAGELRDDGEPADVDCGRGGARSLLDFLEITSSG